MYELREKLDDNEQFQGIEILVNGHLGAALNGGLAIMVTTAYANMANKSNGAAVQDAFLFGIVTALNHCTLTGAIPTVTDGY